MESLNTQIRSNNYRVYILMFSLTLFLALIGGTFSYFFEWGLTGTSIFIIISLIINILGFFYSDKIVLRSTGARMLVRQQAPELFTIVENLSSKAEIPVPSIYILEERTLNAFATGRSKNRSSIALTRGLLERLSIPEIEGVISHEIAHIKNNDVKLMAAAAVIAGIISLIADLFWYSSVASAAQERDRSGIIVWVGILLSVFAPLSAFFIQLAISRKREFVADATGALIAGSSEGLRSALEKISHDMRYPRHLSHATAHLFFSSPAHDGTIIDRLFSTHPPISQRINKLRK